MTDLELFMEKEGRKEAIDGVMSNRHQIAHGRDTRITVVTVSNYLEKCVEVIEYIENQCRK
jgi:hypothetical protein